jgi:S-DNA-T family DNA segregation ATPase FtsK/SpoIIIE
MGLFRKRQQETTKWKLPTIDIFGKTSHQQPKPEDTRLTDEITQLFAKYGCEAELEEVNSGPRAIQFVFKRINGGIVEDPRKLERAIGQELDTPHVRVITTEAINSRVYVELAKEKPEIVYLREALESQEFQDTKDPLSIPVGKNVKGEYIVRSFRTAPHILSAGQTGSGKSNFTENVIIPSLLYKHTPDDLQLVLIDPKYVQFMQYNGIPHLVRPVITDPNEAREIFEWLISEKDNRFRLLAETRTRNIEEYNLKAKMPYIVLIIDEFADLMMIDGDYYEKVIVKLAQYGRAVGIHMHIGTSRPSLDVITGIIKANFPTRLGFTVSSQIDSRTIIDTVGAERLLGKGDLLYSDAETLKPIRLQSPYSTDKETMALVDFWSNQNK